MNDEQRKEFEAWLFANDMSLISYQVMKKAQAMWESAQAPLLARIAELEKQNRDVAQLIVDNDREHAVQWAKGLLYSAEKASIEAPVSVDKLTAAQAVAEAKAACLKEWEDVNDPPCHPSDENWSPCATCLQEASVMTVEYKIANNIWDHVDDALRVIELARAGQWSWMANGRCKYIELRIDMRNGGCLIRNRDGERINPEDFEKQLGRHFHGDGWPSNSAAQAVTDEQDTGERRCKK